MPDCGKMTGESHEAHRVLEPWRVRYREVFGKADLSEPTSIGELLPGRDFVQHPLVKLGPHSGEPRLDFGSTAGARKIEQRRLHLRFRSRAAIAEARLIGATQ